MLSDEKLRAVEDQLLRIGQQAFEAGHYEVAYHSLMAALHCASDDADEARVRRVELAANEQQAWIDRYVPSHRLSSYSAKSRGHLGPYSNLKRQAAAVRLLISQRAEWGQVVKLPSPAPVQPASTDEAE
jgi:hypothetical protein